MLVATLDGRRRCILVRSSLSIRQLRREVQGQAGVPADQQRLLVLQQRALNRAQRCAWALLRLLLAVALWATGWVLAGARALLGLPQATGVQLQLVTESGREVQLDVSPDMTLREMQQLVWEQHGEQLSLQQHLQLSPSKAGSSSPERRDSGGGGGVWGGGAQRSPSPSPSPSRCL